MEQFNLSPHEWIEVLFVLFAVALIIYLCVKDEKDYKDGQGKPDETTARVRYLMSDREYNELLMSELRKDAVKAKTLKGNVVEFKVSDGPSLIKNEEITFMH